MPPVRHWLHPQAVPRGFLRLYILNVLSKGPQSGYSILQRIDEMTEGAWKPGAGTIYPLLKSLLREGLVKSKGRGGRGVSKTYVLTPKGRRRLEEVRRLMSGIGRKEAVMSRLFSDLLPGTAFVSMMVRRFRDGSETFRQKMSEVPEGDRGPLLRELRIVLASQLEWVDSQLASTAAGAT